MTDYKEKYTRAMKALNEAETEAAVNLQDLYSALISILGEMQGSHKEIDKAISALPRKMSRNALPPVDELLRIKDLFVSYLNKDSGSGAELNVLNALLSNLKTSDNLHEGIQEIEGKLSQARTSKDFVLVAKNTASLILNNEGDQQGRGVDG